MSYGREPQIAILNESGSDERGASFSVHAAQLALLGPPRDMHVASIKPGHVRGNHYHLQRRELIVVLPHERWSLYWDEGEDSTVSTRVFAGGNAVAIAIPIGCSHAIRNDGSSPLWLVATSDGRYDPGDPDAHRRVVC